MTLDLEIKAFSRASTGGGKFNKEVKNPLFRTPYDINQAHFSKASATLQ
jgi:hypothetical protein